MVVVSRIWCGIAVGQLYPDNHFEQACIFIHFFVLQQVHNLLQSQFSIECDSSILSFIEGHPVAAYVILLVFPSL